MKKLSYFICASALSLFAFTAQAEPAVLIDGTTCAMIDGNGGFVLTNDTKTVVTNSANSNLMFKCKAEDVINDTGSAVTYDYSTSSIPCGIITDTGFVLTEDWHETVSASGMATLICKYKE